jgi:hypothetical protein
VRAGEQVIRDQCLRTWQFKEKGVEFSREFGSGYPADPFTKQWLEGNLDKLFGYPTLIRFSWATTDNMLEEFDAHAVAWYALFIVVGLVVLMVMMVMMTGRRRRMMTAKARRARSSCSVRRRWCDGPHSAAGPNPHGGTTTPSAACRRPPPLTFEASPLLSPP